jgi:hypothetical protein
MKLPRVRFTIGYLMAAVAVTAVVLAAGFAFIRATAVVVLDGTGPAPVVDAASSGIVVTLLWDGAGRFWGTLVLATTTATAWVVSSRRKKPNRS